MVPVYSSLTESNFTDRTDLIREYFFAGYTYGEIIIILFSRHGISISLRQLNRVLRSQGLRRHRNVVGDDVVQAVQHELQNSGSSLGYRSLTRRLLTSHGITVSRGIVSELLRNLDPVGVGNRRRHQFSRRIYVNKGPNYLIHIDGYDKMKRFGFPIHGAICGFSRRVLWLNVANTNNNPNVVATYFLQYVREIKGVPRCVRMDAGTENTLVEHIQKAFRWDDADDMAANRSVIKASSHSNQRIERWWRSNRQGGCQFWLDLFKDLEASGLLSTGDVMHIECMRFCFMDLLQDELNNVRMEWNQHSVRPCQQSEMPSGKPDIMFYLPNLYGTVDYKIDVDQGDLDQVTREYEVPVSRGCSQENNAVFSRVMNDAGLSPPSTVQEALELYGRLVEHLL